MSDAPFAYDDVPYDTKPHPDAHPRAMATVARLFGLAPAPLAGSRTLEIGCGDGEHLIAAATYLPEAAFVGFDLAGPAIEAGLRVAEACGARNVRLERRDVRDVRAAPRGDDEGFDFVVAHGLYSWVPPAVQDDALAVVRRALAPEGVAFLSVNALPGWELRRALRMLMRRAVAGYEPGIAGKKSSACLRFDPGAEVGRGLAAVREVGAVDAPGFPGVLAAAARAYEEHVRTELGPEAPFSRYVFHDLLAECNEPLSVPELVARLARAGLRLVAETPPAPGRAPGLAGLAAHMEKSGLPFLQVLVCRDDAAPAAAPDPRAALDLTLWADLAPLGTNTYRTTTGHEVRAAADPVLAEAFARAAAHAPGFVPVRRLVEGLDDADALRVARELCAAFAGGVLTLLTEPPATAPHVPELPRAAPHVRWRAADAVARGAAAIVANALHRSFEVPLEELAVLARLDGCTSAHTIPERLPKELASRVRVADVLARLARYQFLVR